ncbi:hypothetical protein [Azospirillum sp.]|uniref:hypothetical protein n=1 Tax=Azospirillum sp. TaxID=34012 RepID=UPI002D630BDE|nr:hypothetical protein [Azospirillum sp.]HYD71403.1 hypothetical protein [Azospirillum sp.]
MPDVLTRTEFDRLWKDFIRTATTELGTRAEVETFRKVMLSQTDALQSMIGAVEQMKEQIEALYALQSAQHAQIAALSVVCGTLGHGLVAAGIPAAEVRRAINGARAILPESMQADGSPAIDAVLAIVREE